MRVVLVNDDATSKFVFKLTLAGLQGEPSDEWVIADAENALRVEFPAAYKAFLMIAGNGCEPLEGSHYTIDDDLSELQRTGRRIAQYEKIDWPSDAFVFLTHQGFACQFFLIHDGDDPAVYECVKGLGLIRCVAATFTQWLDDQLRQYEDLRARRLSGA